MWAQLLPMIMNMFSSSQQQGQQKQQQEQSSLGKLGFGPTEQPMQYGSGSGKQSSMSSYIQPNSKPIDLSSSYNPTTQKSSGMDINMIMKMIMGLIGSKGGGSSGGFFNDMSGYQSPSYNTGGLNSAFSNYQNSQLGNMDWGNMGNYGG